MALVPGKRLGHYEVVAPLGAGGMGEVYRARDTTLGRDVALKVLPPEVTGDAERLARFRREAQLLASLNHPNIAAIHGLEEADGQPFLVLELVEGETLQERLARGRIPLDDALPIARQIAEALEEAHEHGIVHRDLKPANVKLTPEGQVKVLDFGLAKALGGDGDAHHSDVSRSPTLTREGTEAGVILGSAAYMSPEQARGKRVDRRADIWAFGVVLFEMLTGRRLFQGETVTDTLAAVLKTDPDWRLLPAETPGRVRELLGRCLDRDPRQRLRDMGDARVDLELARASADPDLGPGGRSRLDEADAGRERILLVFERFNLEHHVPNRHRSMVPLRPDDHAREALPRPLPGGRIRDRSLVPGQPDPAPLGRIGEDPVVERALAEIAIVFDAVHEPSGFPQRAHQSEGNVFIGEDDEASVGGHYFA